MGKTEGTVKIKKEEEDAVDTKEDLDQAERPPYKELITKVNVIAKPLASKKFTKKLYKTIKKGT